VDNRLLSLKLVKSGMTMAAMFGPDGGTIQPSEVLYKKNVLILRGRFRPVTHVNVDMLLASRRQFLKDPSVDKNKMVLISELTLQDLKGGDDRDFLNRVDIVCSLGQTVMISNYYRYYKLVEYLSEHTKKKKIGIILGINNLKRVFDEKYYEDLRGGILESFGTLFGRNVKLLVYPSLDSTAGNLITLNEIKLPKHLRGLFNYLKENDKMEDVTSANTDLLNIVSDHALKMIQEGKSGWEHMLPKKVTAAIKEKHLFNYPGEKSQGKRLSVKAS